MDLSVLDFVVCTLGVGITTAKDFYDEGNKFQNSEEDFDAKRYFKKNKWDFIFYFLGGIGSLFVKDLIFQAMNLPKTNLNLSIDYGSSLIAGLVGSFVLGGFIDQGKKIKWKR